MSITAEQASRFRRELIAYFAENKNMLRSDIHVEDEDHIILFKQDAQANFYDLVIPASMLLTEGGTRLIDATLKEDLEIQLAVGNLVKGTVYLKGTHLETLWRDMVSTNTLVGFTFATYSSLVEVGTNVIPNLFTWTETGEVGTVTITDGIEGNTVEAVVPNQAGWTPQYQFLAIHTVVWDITSSAIGLSGLLTTKWIYASYYGISNDLAPGSPPPAINPLDPSRLIVEVETSITVNLITTNSEYGWIAVPATNPTYTKWMITELNKGNINDGSDILEFIRYDGLITINGVEYKLYAYNYPSEQLQPITLY